METTNRAEDLKAFYEKMTKSHKEDGSLDYGDQIGNLIVHRSIQNNPTKLYHIIDENISSILSSVKPLHIIDAGCGYGGTSMFLGSKYKQHQYYGVTLSPSQVEIGTEAAKKMNVNNLKLEVRNYHIFADDEMYDILIAIESLAHSDNHEYTLSKWVKHVKVGGKLIIIDDFVKDEVQTDYHLQELSKCWIATFWKWTEWKDMIEKLGMKVNFKEDLYSKFGFFTPKTDEELLTKIDQLEKSHEHPGYIGAMHLEWVYGHGQMEYNFLILERVK